MHFLQHSEQWKVGLDSQWVTAEEFPKYKFSRDPFSSLSSTILWCLLINNIRKRWEWLELWWSRSLKYKLRCFCLFFFFRASSAPLVLTPPQNLLASPAREYSYCATVINCPSKSASQITLSGQVQSTVCKLNKPMTAENVGGWGQEGVRYKVRRQNKASVSIQSIYQLCSGNSFWWSL